MIEVVGGFDGSTSDDFTAIRLEDRDGYQWTPTYGPDARPTIWNPAAWGGEIPRGEVHAAWAGIAAEFRIRRVYCDPRDWDTEINNWALAYGDQVFVVWPTNRIERMYPALRRFVTDLSTGALTHDRCEITAQHVANARKIAKSGDKYILGKPNNQQKIDAAMASVLAHEARSDAIVDGWSEPRKRRMVVY